MQGAVSGEMPRGESGSSPRKRAAATELHERLSKDELIKRLKVRTDRVYEYQIMQKTALAIHWLSLCQRVPGFLLCLPSTVL